MVMDSQLLCSPPLLPKQQLKEIATASSAVTMGFIYCGIGESS